MVIIFFFNNRQEKIRIKDPPERAARDMGIVYPNDHLVLPHHFGGEHGHQFPIPAWVHLDRDTAVTRAWGEHVRSYINRAGCAIGTINHLLCGKPAAIIPLAPSVEHTLHLTKILY